MNDRREHVCVSAFHLRRENDNLGKLSVFFDEKYKKYTKF